MRHIRILMTVVLLGCTNQRRQWQSIVPDLTLSSSIFVAGSVNNESVPYCPYYGGFCRHSYNEQLAISNTSDAYSTCCERCESDASTMRCCSEIMPCKSDITSDQGQSLVCIRTVSVLYDIGVLAVATCPEHSDNEQQRKCVQQYNAYNVEANDVVPVRDITTRTLYRNIYCAFCNGIDIANMTFWDVHVGCTSTRTLGSNLLNTIHQDPDCYFTFIDPEPTATVESCMLSIARCNEVNTTSLDYSFKPTTKQNCLSGVKVEVVEHGILYRNEHCAKCNGVDRPESPGPPPYPAFSILLTVDRQKKLDNPHPPSICERGAVFIRAKRQCVEARCSLLRQLRGNVCERILPNPDSFVYRIGFRLFPKDMFHNRPRRAVLDVDTGYNDIHPELGNLISSLLLSVLPSKYLIVYEAFLAADVGYKDTFNATEILQADLVFYEVHAKLVYSEPHDPEEKLQEWIGLEDVVTLDVVKGQHNISFLLRLKDDTMHLGARQHPKTACNYIFHDFSSCAGLEASKPYRLDNLTAVPLVGTNVNPDLSDFFSTPATSERSILELRNCPFVKVARSEMVWTETELGIEFVRKQAVYLIRGSEFVYGESLDTIWMCLETYERVFSSQDGSLASCLRAGCVLNAMIVMVVYLSHSALNI